MADGPAGPVGLRGPDDPRLASLAVPHLVDPDALIAYAGDESVVSPVVPGAVVRARSVDDVAATMRWAHEHGVPVTPRGAGSGKAGGCVPVPGGVVLSLASLDSVTAVRPEHGFAEVEPGVVTGTFRDAMAHEHRLFYPPDPASLDWCTLGGNVATNAGGPVALKYGVTGRFVMGLTLVLADGRVIETGRRQPKDVAGYDLTSLVVGSEGTLAVVVGARLALLPEPAEVRAALLGFASLEDAAAALVDARRAGVLPRAMELVDPVTLRRIRAAEEGPDGRGDDPFGFADSSGEPQALLLVELDGPLGTTEPALSALLSALDTTPVAVRQATTTEERAALWELRRQISKRVKQGAAGWVTEDIAVPLGAMPSVVRELEDLGARHGLEIAAYGHIGDGNLHVNVLWPSPDAAARAPAAVDDVMALAMRVGGTVSGEHGVGRAKRRWVEAQLGPTRELQRALKRAWDPRGILNPGVGAV